MTVNELIVKLQGKVAEGKGDWFAVIYENSRQEDTVIIDEAVDGKTQKWHGGKLQDYDSVVIL